MATSQINPKTPREQERDRYKDGPFDQVDVPALTSFVVCLLGLFLLLSWVRSLDGRTFGFGGEETDLDRVARILMPPRMAFVAAQAPIPKLAPAMAKPRRTSLDPSARARIERSRQAVVEHIENVQRAVQRSGVLSILSGSGPGARGAAVGGLGSRLKLSGLGSLSSRLNGLEGLTRYDNPGNSRETDAATASAGIDKLAKGFDNARVGSLSKIGTIDLDRPTRKDRSDRFASSRNLQDLQAFVSRKQTSIRMLYEERLRTRPELEGKLTLQLTIQEDGTVSNVEIITDETTLEDNDLVSEILRVVRRWIFPAFTGGAVEIKTPFVLKPR